MKKIISVFTALILLLSIFASCTDKKLAAAQEDLIDQLGYSYYNELLILNRDLGQGHRVYYIFGFDDNVKINELAICRFFTDDEMYESYKASVEQRVQYKECTILMDETEALMFAYNDTVELSDIKGLTFSEAKERYVSNGWTYVMKTVSSSSSADSGN